MLLGARQFFERRGASALPYDEIQSVASDGTAFCALPYVNSSNTARMRMTYTMSKNFSPPSDPRYIFGSHGPSFRGIFLIYGGTSWLSGFMFNKYLGGDPYDWLTENVEREFMMEHTDSGWHATLDGQDMPLGVQGSGIVNNATRQLIFSANGAWRTGDVIVPTACANFIAITHLEYSDGTGYSCNLIPCREKTTREVCFWDTVNEEFIKNIAGSGTLLEINF